MKKIYLLMMVLLITVCGWSQKTWDGGGGGTSWATANNWNPNGVPSTTDVVTFNTGTSLTITNVPNGSIGGLVISSGTVTLSGAGGNQTLTINNRAAANDFFVASGATLIQNGNLEVISLATSAGASIEGTFTNNGEFNLGTSSTAAISGIVSAGDEINMGTNSTITISGTLNLNGDLNMSGNNSAVTLSGTLNNDGTIDVDANSARFTVSGTGVLVNQDAITVNNATKLVFQSGATYEHDQNGGTIPTAGWDVNSKLNFKRGGNMTAAMQSDQTVGLVTVSNNTALTITSNDMTIGNSSAATDLVVNTGSSFTVGANANLIMAANSAADISGTLTVNGGRTFNTNGNGVVTTVSGTGIVVNAGTITNTNASRFVFANGSIYRHNQGTGTVATATWQTGSTCEITGSVSGRPGGLGQSFHNFTWNATGQSTSVNLDGALRTVNGNLTIASTNQPRALRFTGDDNFTLAVGGNMTVGNDVALIGVYDGDGDGVVNVAGSYSQVNGSDVVLYSSDNTTDGSFALNIAGDFTKTGGDFDFTTGDASSGTGVNGSLSVGGNFSHTGGGMTTTTEDQDVSNGVITFNKAGLQTFTLSNTASITYVNFIVANGSTLQMASNLNLSRHGITNWRGHFTVENGGVLDVNTRVIGSQNSDNNAVFTLAAGAKIITANATGVQGSINTNNITASFSNGADYEFQGNATGVFTTTNNEVRDLIINHNSGAQVTMSRAFNVTRTLNMSNGYLTPGANLLTVTETGTAVTNGVSYVNGRMDKKTNTTASFTFPVGKLGAGIRTIGITPNGTGGSTFRAEFLRDNGKTAIANGTIMGSGISNVSTCEYWTLNRTVGAVGASVTLSWSAASNCTAGAYVTELSSLRVARHDGTAWSNAGPINGADMGSILSTGTITSSVMTSFSPFALATTTLAENPLPVLFADVKAYQKNAGIQVDWSNLTERDIAHYNVERSADGVSFYTIDEQLPKNNLDNKASYTYFDGAPLAGSNFYRVRVQEKFGKVIYSKILRVETGAVKAGFSLYPNPVTGNQMTISLTGIKQGKYNLQVYNTAGQHVFYTNITNGGTGVTQMIELPSTVKPGVYTSVVTGDNYRQSKTFIVQ